MAIINKIDNVASVQYNGQTLNSLPVSTILLVLPTIVKTVDKAIASINDVLTYTVTVTNLGLSELTNLPFTDVIPVGVTYVDASFKVNGVAATPTFTNNTLTFTIPSVSALGAAVITFQVKVVGGTV